MISNYGTYTVQFGDYTNHDYGLFATRPDIPSTEWAYKETTVPGKDGALVTYDGTVVDIPIKITFGFTCDQCEWGASFRAAKSWLLSRKSGTLTLGDDASVFYRVKPVSVDTAERAVWEFGQFTATFICEGYQYIGGGRDFLPVADAQFNPYLPCKPVYKITGVGTAILTVNGNKLEAVVQTDCVIDTDKLIAYTTSGQRKNKDITGDFEDFVMQSGKNEVSISDGFTLEIKPNWRCF